MGHVGGESGTEGRVLRVGIAAAASGSRALLRDRLTRGGCRCTDVPLSEPAVAGLMALDVIVLHVGVGREAALALVSAVQAAAPGLAVVVVADDPALDLAVRAMRIGAADLIDGRASGDEMVRRIEAAAARTHRSRESERRLRRLRRVCRKLHSAREEMSAQVGSLCEDLARAYGDVARRASMAAAAGEFSGVIRGELDLESLLRSSLEYMLARTGPTNAAIFLPASSGDFSLGAYVNFDRPRDSVEMMLDHLCECAGPALQNEDHPVVLRGREAIQHRLGSCAEWLGEVELVGLPCMDNGECLAVLVLFRPRHEGFDGEALAMIRTMAGVFGRQLARVVRVHNRHQTKQGLGGNAGDLGLSL